VLAQPTLDRQEQGFEDVLLTPLLLHYRPFNSRHAPYTETQYVVDDATDEIDGHDCLLLRPRDGGRFELSRYHYYVAPALNFATVRIDAAWNGNLAWRYQIQYEQIEGRWQPANYMIQKFRDEQIAEFAKVTVAELQINQPIDDDLFRYDDISDQ
ncbi:MAG: hypothetical protein HKN47_12410, partial [Pirellulaceae bacterium]|nr:hypothetical protein [Pirellulaceae bacterium]